MGNISFRGGQICMSWAAEGLFMKEIGRIRIIGMDNMFEIGSIGIVFK